MTELVDRYVHQVGRYLPAKERAEIEAELRSQIQDQLDDRYAGAPSQADVVSVLLELGDPRRMAASYSGGQYLVGPDLYPTMMRVLRRGWLLVPTLVVFVNVAAALAGSPQGTLPGLFIDTMLTALGATFVFSAIVVLIFATIQHTGIELSADAQAFHPMSLPEVNHPGSIDRLELAFGMAFGTFAALVLVYFLRVGGLTMRVNLSDPGEVVPAPASWMSLLVVTIFAQLILHVLVLRRNHWRIGSLAALIGLELFGTVCLYFAVILPLSRHIFTANPPPGDGLLADTAALIVTGLLAANTLAHEGSRLVRLWNYRPGSSLPFSVQTDG